MAFSLFQHPVRLAVLALVVGLAGHSRAVMAHEIGTTRAVVSFPQPDQYVVALSVDAAALLAKLETLAQIPRSGTLTPPQYQERIEMLQQEFLKHVEVSFDGEPVQPVFDYSREDGAPGELGSPGAIIRLRGPKPSGARTLTWRYDLTYATYAVTLSSPTAAEPHTEWLEGGQSRSFNLDAYIAAPSRARIAATYFSLGFTHILPGGLDHILFVLGIFLFGRRLRPMLWQISAFTVAHSITLGLTLYGVVSLSPAIVEPLIALSIVCVAVENLFTSTLTPWRVAVVFGFGLLHGMGFAGALRELGLPRSEFLTGLVTFNAGVEAGQLAIVAGAFLLVARWSSHHDKYRRWIVVPGSAVIAVTGVYWTIARLPVHDLTMRSVF